MAILVDSGTKVICQGITGWMGSFYTSQAIAYGTKVVGGVRPGKGGIRCLDVPVFDTVSQATEQTGADASIIFVPPANAGAAMIEAIEAGVPLVVCVTERVPVLDMVRVKHALRGSRTRLVGPNSQGVLSPGRCKIGVMSTANERPGRIGIVSRSASLTSEIVSQTTKSGHGQSTTIGIGGDPVHGMDFVDCLKLFLEDDETDAIVLIGEMGGMEEQEAAEFIKSAGPGKPIVALIVGRHAPPERRMGHAGTLPIFGRSSAHDKINALRDAGIYIADDADAIVPALDHLLAK